jgi:hypothetical protein
MIKVINERRDGTLYHYAHFICDCLFPEVVNELYKYKKIVRKKVLGQTLGNFSKIYNKIMRNENIEIENKQFDKLDIPLIKYGDRDKHANISDFNKFRNYIFSRCKIDPLAYDKRCSKVILIKRDVVKNLIDDPELEKINTNNCTGKQRREINNIDQVECFLRNKYQDDFKSICLEHMSFKKQVRYFNNAKLIVLAHGAAMSNLFFCKANTTVIEVTCCTFWDFFNKITNILKLKHVKCHQNNKESVINCIKRNQI